MRAPDRAGRLALLALLALSAGCVNPFRPADPQQPEGGVVQEDFRTPEDVLNTMAAAIQSKSSSGATAWFHAFAESIQVGDRNYRQFYDGAVKQSWQSATSLAAPEPWDGSLERGLPSRLFGFRATASYAFVWGTDPDSPSDDINNDVDTVQFHRKYQLLASTSTSANQEIIATGFADLSLFKPQGGSRWFISRWNDRLDKTYGVNPPNSEYSMSRHRLDSLTGSQ